MHIHKQHYLIPEWIAMRRAAKSGLCQSLVNLRACLRVPKSNNVKKYNISTWHPENNDIGISRLLVFLVHLCSTEIEREKAIF